MNPQLNRILDDYKRKLIKSIDHLEYSYKKVLKLSAQIDKLDDEKLQTWESFLIRFSRAVNLFLSKYLRTLFLIQDPAFTGTLIDVLNQAEKQSLISDAKLWYKIRELRNIEAHEYTEEMLGTFFETIRRLAPSILDIKKVL